MARTPHRAPRWSPTTCTCDRRADHLVSRVDGVSRSVQPRRASASPASRCPAFPSLVVGSNGHVAWGFTNTGGDWSDLVRIEPDPRDPQKYLTPDGPKAFEVFEETIAAKGAAGEDGRRSAGRSGDRSSGRTRAAASTRSAGSRTTRTALAADITKPERARTVDELLDAVAGLGIPNQNVDDGGYDGPHRVDDRRRDPEARRPRRHDARVVGRRHASLGRLPHRRGVPAHRRSAGRPHLDRERAGRRRRDAGDDRRRRLRRRHPRAADSRSADEHRQGHAAGHARHPARGPARCSSSAGASCCSTTLGTRCRHGARRARNSGGWSTTTWTGRASPDSVGYRLVKEFRAAVRPRA